MNTVRYPAWRHRSRDGFRAATLSVRRIFSFTVDGSEKIRLDHKLDEPELRTICSGLCIIDGL